MKIILADGAELQPIVVTAEKKFVHNANRDVITFVFDGSSDLNALDSYFTEANCESISIVDGAEAIYAGYTIRVCLEKKDVVEQVETANAEAVTVSRVFVSMAQRTYTETKMKELEEKMNMLLNA